MSVTVGFSPAPVPQLANASGAGNPAGSPDIFAALLSMLVPGSDPAKSVAPDGSALAGFDKLATEAKSKLPAPAVAALDSAAAGLATAVEGLRDRIADLEDAREPTPPAVTPPPEPATVPPGKHLLKELASALKVAKTALDGGEPFDPALEQKLTEAAVAVAAWFAAQAPIQPSVPGTTSSEQVTGAAALLPAAAANLLAATPDSATSNPPTEAKPTPAALSKLGEQLEQMAAQLTSSPALAEALSALGHRLSDGEFPDDILVQLGMTRSPESSSPAIDQLVAALATPPGKLPSAAQKPTLASPSLALPDDEVDEGELSAPTPAASNPRAVKLKPQVHLEAEPAQKPTATEPRAPTSDPAAKPADTSTAVPNGAPASSSTAPGAPATASSHAAAARLGQAYTLPPQQLNFPQVAFELARQFESGASRFQIRLDPAELGRIDVKLDLEKNGTVNARLFVERPETLDLMLRDQRALQQALQQAGLDTGKTNLEFSLRQNPFGGSGTDSGQGGNPPGHHGYASIQEAAGSSGIELAAHTLYRGTASAGGVNLFV